MKYFNTISLKNGQECVLRNGRISDTREICELFIKTHSETDYLLTYPEESSNMIESEEKYLSEKEASDDSIEICALIDGKIVGFAGFDPVGKKEKVRHRAEFGISVQKDCWGLGVGRALTEACIKCAKAAGYVQLELEVVAENTRAISLYKSVGFSEFGRNPKGFRSRLAGWQEIVLMRLELES